MTTQPPIFNLTEPGPAFANFVAGMRDLQDLAVSAAADETIWEQANQHIAALRTLLTPYEAAEGRSPAGRSPSLPGAGSLLMPPWAITAFAPEGVALTVEYSRFYVGARASVHGGALPMLFDLTFGVAIHAAGLPFSRTAQMDITYRQRVPINTPITAHGRITHTEGRKTDIASEIRDQDGAVLAECVGLLIAPVPKKEPV